MKERNSAGVRVALLAGEEIDLQDGAVKKGRRENRSNMPEERDTNRKSTERQKIN